MPIGILFWGMMLFWLIFGIVAYRNPQWAWAPFGNQLFQWFLFFFLGWAVFGFILQGGRAGPFLH